MTDWEDQAAHQTRLAQWVLRTLGQALLVGALIGGVIGVIGVLVGAAVLVAVAPFAGMVAFGVTLAGADAPRAPARRH